MQRWGKRHFESGFTLVELLIAIVVVGILTAVALVGIAGLQDRGAHAACSTSMDAAYAATLAYYTNSGGTYPQKFDDLTSSAAGQPLLKVQTGVSQTATTLTGKDWTLTLQPGATTTQRTTFAGC